jgi:hypothetical protein
MGDGVQAHQKQDRDRPLSPHSSRSGAAPERLLRSCSDDRLNGYVGRKTDAQAMACYRGTLPLASGPGRAQGARGQPAEARSMPGCLGAVGMDADRREKIASAELELP